MTDPMTGPVQAEIQIAQRDQQYGDLLVQKRSVDRQIEAQEMTLMHLRAQQRILDEQVKEIEGLRAGVELGRAAGEAQAVRDAAAKKEPPKKG